MENDTVKYLKRKINSLESEKMLLQKELAVKNVISEISRFQGKDEDIDIIYRRIFALLSELVHIDNFYICVVIDGFINIPFIVDQFDDVSLDMRYERTNINLRHSLTGYALKKNTSLMFEEADIIELEKSGEVKLFGKMPQQWVFIPFHTNNLIGGIVAQSYVRKDGYSYSDMSLMSYVTMHVGNFLSAYNSKEKIKQQFEALKSAQSQLVHSEKMASIGQLAAGIAHEINNPLGYVNSNLNTLKDYVGDLNTFVHELKERVHKLECAETIDKLLLELQDKHDVDFILSDTEDLVSESIFGMSKVKNIIHSLKNFTHAGDEDKRKTNINNCLDETLRFVWNEIKYHCEIEKHYQELPEIYCFPSQLNQVFINLLINAGHAIKESGIIQVITEHKDDWVIIKIKDNGSGIKEENLSQLFNPFFTTKPVGQGTGLGLSISYGIIEKHEGTIEVESEVGKGTCFIIKLPVIESLSSIEDDS